METQGRTFAKRLKVLRKVKFSETWPFPTECGACQTTAMQKKRDNTDSVSREDLAYSKRMLRESANHAPFKATVFFLTEWMASSGITVFPALKIGATLTSSHSMGTWSAHYFH